MLTRPRYIVVCLLLFILVADGGPPSCIDLALAGKLADDDSERCAPATFTQSSAVKLFSGKRVVFVGDSTTRRLYIATAALLTGSEFVDVKDVRLETRLDSKTVVEYIWSRYMESVLEDLVALSTQKSPPDMIVFSTFLHDLLYRHDDMLVRVEKFGRAVAALKFNKKVALVWSSTTSLVKTKMSGLRLTTTEFDDGFVVDINAAFAKSITNSSLLIMRGWEMTQNQDAETEDGLHYSGTVMARIAQTVAQTLHVVSPKEGPVIPLSDMQVALAILMGAFGLWWAVAELTTKPEAKPIAVDSNDIESARPARTSSVPPDCGEWGKWWVALLSSGHKKPSEDPRHVQLDALRNVVLLAGVVVWVWLNDGTADKLLPSTARTYSRDFFAFLLLCILAYSLMTMRKLGESQSTILNRDQTEEWKGWMQIMFVLYHYFAAKEIYNIIRIYIAAYVWMTGFGNFSYFWIKEDFSLKRSMRMLFRLNFFVAVICVALNKEYMLYYVCPLHTFVYLTVYGTMGIGHRLNKTAFIYVKFALLFVVMVVVFHVPGVFEIVFAPFYPLLSFKDSWHEWRFRATLDHLIFIWGMFCAYIHPWCTSMLAKLDAERSKGIKAVIGVVAVVSLAVWTNTVLLIPSKFDYNKLHPYTSIVPITGYLVLRNLWAPVRGRVLQLLAWLGKITLETYILQFHVFMSADATRAIAYAPGYPLISFVIGTALYVLLSYIVFRITENLAVVTIPSEGSTRQLLLRWGAALLGWGALIGAVKVLR